MCDATPQVPASSAKSKKHVVSDDEDYSDEADDDSDDEVPSHAHGSPGSPSCRVPIPML